MLLSIHSSTGIRPQENNKTKGRQKEEESVGEGQKPLRKQGATLEARFFGAGPGDGPTDLLAELGLQQPHIVHHRRAESS